MAKKLGQTQYYRHPSQQQPYPYYEASAWAGNVPHGMTSIGEEEYLKGIKGWAAYAKEKGYPSREGYEKEVGEMEGRTGRFAPGYIDPSMKKFLPDAPTPSEQYFTPEYKAEQAKKVEGMVNIGTEKAPLWVPPGTQKPGATPPAPPAPASPAPEAPAPKTYYKIESGDTLSKIAIEHNTTVADLMAANPQIKDPNLIIAGASLNIPGAAAPTAPADGGITCGPGYKSDPVTKACVPITKPEAPGAPGAPDAGAEKPEVPGAEAPEVPGDETPSDQEQSLMDKFGWSLDEARDPETIKNKVDEIATQINDAATDLDKETAIQDMVELAAAMGLPYPEKYVEAMTATEGKTEEEIKTELYTKYGIEDLEDKFKERPTQTFEEIYEDAFDDLGLSDLRTQIKDLSTKIADKEEKRDNLIADINENPWLSEASRVGRSKRAWDMSQRELDRLQNQMTLADTLYNRGKEEAEAVATRALNTFDKEREWTKEELSYYIDRADADLEAKMATQEAEAEKEKFRYYPDYVKEYKAKVTGAPTSHKEWELAGGLKRTGKTYAEWLKDEGAGGKTYGTYSTRLKDEINNVYKGQYGKEGSREEIIKILQAEFPDKDVSADVYRRVPDGYEGKIKKEVMDVKDLPEDQRIFINQVQAKVNTRELPYDDAVANFPAIAVYLKPPGW